MSIEPDGQQAASADLGTALQQLRKAAGLSQERLATRCAMSQSKVSRIERGKEFGLADVQRILVALDVPSEAAEQLLTLARRANVEHVSVRALAEIGLWRKQAELKALAASCRVQRSFLPIMVSGLLQTPEYVRAALSPTIPSAPSRDVDKAVAARLDRQAILSDESRQFHFLMTEQAVRWKRIDRLDMARQCAHLAGLAERPNIEVAIIPLSAQVPGAPLNSFSAFDDRLVVAELLTGEVVYREHKDVQYHLDLFDFFWKYALTGDRAKGFLLSVRDEFM